MNFQTACVFVDGENLRHSICDLFTQEQFEPSDYLPKQANWQGFFDFLVQEARASVRLRTYWYAVAEIDFSPFGLSRLTKPAENQKLLAVLQKHRAFSAQLQQLPVAERVPRALAIAEQLLRKQKQMQDRFTGWHTIQNGIAHKVESVEFRRAGSIRYNLHDGTLGSEKGVDVKLATDLLRLKDIYDVAIIVSGDGDYVPAVQAVKDSGKHVINVSFMKRGGGLLPGGARRLNEATDRVLEIPYATITNFLLPPTQMNLPAIGVPPAPVQPLAN